MLSLGDCAIKEDGLILFALVKKVVGSSLGGEEGGDHQGPPQLEKRAGCSSRISSATQCS